MKLWKKADVNMEKQYVLLLLERADGLRYFQLADIERADAIATGGSDFVFMTQTVPLELALDRDVAGIASGVTLSNGEPFYIDAHGNWFTKDETNDLVEGRADVRWVRGRMPMLPPQ